MVRTSLNFKPTGLESRLRPEQIGEVGWGITTSIG